MENGIVSNQPSGKGPALETCRCTYYSFRGRFTLQPYRSAASSAEGELLLQAVAPSSRVCSRSLSHYHPSPRDVPNNRR